MSGALSTVERWLSKQPIILRSRTCATGAGWKSAPSDRTTGPIILAAIGRTGAESLFRRFFAIKRGFTEKEIEFFLDIDFIAHVALVAVIEEEGRSMLVGGGRYMVVQPGKAEVAFAIVDQYQGQGIGARLMHHLAAIARICGVREFIAEVLQANTPMLKVFEKSGFDLSTKREPGVVHVALRLT